VAVLEVLAHVNEVKMISDRARGVVRVVETWEARNVGKTDRCAYAIAWNEAQAKADKLNATEYNTVWS